MPEPKLPIGVNAKAAELLYTEQGSNHTIAVYARDNLRWMRFDDSEIQSVYDRSKPWHPFASYCKSMLAALCFCPEPKRVLNLGLGGGTFERFFAAKLPNIKMTTVESCPTVIKLAKRYFQLPSKIEIIQSSGWDFVRSSQTKFDMIFIDLFDETGHLHCVEEAKFYEDLALTTTDSGILVIDISPQEQDALLSILLSIRAVFYHVHLCTDLESSNMILICSRKPLPEPAEALTRAAQLSHSMDIEFAGSIKRFSALPTPEQS
ncbi:MAG: hypothetical protein AB8B81_03320 [Halioglobus sp.]